MSALGRGCWRALVAGSALWLAAGCDLGSTGPGGGDGDGSGDGVDLEEPVILCDSQFTASGSLQHGVTPVPGESCNGTGSWTITITNPQGTEDNEACPAAPAEATFHFNVTGEPKNYAATDLDDGGRQWDVDVADKGGSCRGDFTFMDDGGVEWSLGASEDGQSGTLSGLAHFVTWE